MIVCRTPLRVSLVGGGTDVPEFFEKHPGCVVSMAINKYVYIMVNDKFDGRYRVSYSRTENVDKISDIKHNLVRTALETWKAGSGGTGWGHFNQGLEIVSISDIPGEGSGLGSSSSFMVGLLNAFRYRNQGGSGEFPKKMMADYAFEIEQISNPSIGKQDHYAAAFGGLNLYVFNKDDNDWIVPISERLDCINPWSWSELHEHMLLLWTGTTRKSNDILRAQKEGFDSGRSFQVGKELSSLAHQFAQSLSDGSIQTAASIISTGWALKQSLAPGISNQWIDDWYAKAMNNGAWGGKLCGAGGGGFLFFIAPPDTHDRIVKATGLRKIDFNIDHEGSVIIKREGYESF